MIKKLFTVGIFALVLGMVLGGGLAFAEEGKAVPTSDQPETNCVDSADTNCAQDVVVISDDEITEPDDSVEVTDCISSTDGSDCVETTTGRPVASGCDENDLECLAALASDEEDTEAEPTAWPMYVSLGALGLAILVFIILNCFGGKKK